MTRLASPGEMLCKSLRMDTESDHSMILRMFINALVGGALGIAVAVVLIG